MCGVYLRWLTVSAVAYVVAHHLGLLPDGLGAAPEGTQWADWLQLLVPVLVLVPAAAVMRASTPPPREWLVFGAGCVVYAWGQGMHLAANSINNARPGRTAHLWDEIVGHLVWYLGTAVVMLALAQTMRGRARCGPIGYLVALSVGLTWASNAIGGHTEVLSLVGALVAVWFGWRRRGELAGTLLVGFLPAVLILAVAVGTSL